jgi:hypothetical protein
VSGVAPDFSLPPEAKKTIVYYEGNPEKNIPKEILDELKNQNISFKKRSIFSRDVSVTRMFICNKLAGVYMEDINVYDGLVDMDFALANGLRVYSGGPNGALDLSNIKKREYGLYYPGYFLALNNL